MIFGKMYELLEFNASQIACSIGIQMVIRLTASTITYFIYLSAPVFNG